MSATTLKGGQQLECADCRRPLPMEEALFNGKCRICAKLKNPWAKATMPTPPRDTGICPTCQERKRTPARGYCRPCQLAHNRRWKKDSRERLSWQRKFAGVDIDAVHRNPRWMKPKLKKAA